jgi:signal peptidase II
MKINKFEPLMKFGKKSLYMMISCIVIVVDQITKFWVQSNLIYAKFYAVLPYLNLHFVYNKGIAFSMFAASSDNIRLGILYLNILISLALTIVIYRADPSRKIFKVGLCLVLGGAIGNIIDKLYLGAVIDFIDIYWQNWHFATFNIADSAITCGAILVFIDQVFKSNSENVKSHPEPPLAAKPLEPTKSSRV